MVRMQLCYAECFCIWHATTHAQPQAACMFAAMREQLAGAGEPIQGAAEMQRQQSIEAPRQVCLLNLGMFRAAALTSESALVCTGWGGLVHNLLGKST